MTKTRFLIIFAFLILSYLGVKAQCPDNCANQRADVKRSDVNPFPNELEGFSFFAEGKIGALRLGISTREDIGKIFGAPLKVNGNQETYDYDADWLIQFGYFDYSSPSNFCSKVKGNRTVKNYVILPEHFKTIAFINLVPKRKITFNEKKASLEKFTGTGIYRSRESPSTIEYKSYQDLNGLVYFVDFKDSDTQGNIKNITYSILPSRQCEMFIEQK